MTASVAPLAPSTAAGPALHRVLGVVGLLASPAFFLQWLATEGVPKNDTTATLIGLGYLLGFACSAVGLRRLRVTGRGRGAAALFAIQCVGLLLAAGQQVQDLMGTRPLGDAAYLATDVAWPLSHVFMLVVGVAVLRAGVWRGWRRWTPLACGLVLPLSFLPAAIWGHAAMGVVFCPGTALAFGALGLAIATAPETRASGRG
ncbi:MAG: hypothetical protein ACXW05_04950 [Gemmatirosa sp.]